MPYGNWDSINKEQNTFQVLVLWQLGLVCSLEYFLLGNTKSGNEGFEFHPASEEVLVALSLLQGPFAMAFKAVGSCSSSSSFTGPLFSPLGLIKWCLSNSLGPPQGCTLQKKTSLLELCNAEADCSILSWLVLLPCFPIHSHFLTEVFYSRLSFDTFWIAFQQ